MTSIITGDIIKSRKVAPPKWLDDLQQLLSELGGAFEIYRGDEFQLEVKPENALNSAIKIKALMRKLGLDVRMSIGFGDKTYVGKTLSQSNGSAFLRSGELFETLKKQKINLAVESGSDAFDREINLMLKLSLSIMDHWLVQSAEYVLLALEYGDLSQEELGQKLGINQAAVSRRRKRAYFDLIIELETYFRKRIKELS